MGDRATLTSRRRTGRLPPEQQRQKISRTQALPHKTTLPSMTFLDPQLRPTSTDGVDEHHHLKILPGLSKAPCPTSTSTEGDRQARRGDHLLQLTRRERARPEHPHMDRAANASPAAQRHASRRRQLVWLKQFETSRTAHETNGPPGSGVRFRMHPALPPSRRHDHDPNHHGQKSRLRRHGREQAADVPIRRLRREVAARTGRSSKSSATTTRAPSRRRSSSTKRRSRRGSPKARSPRIRCAASLPNSVWLSARRSIRKKPQQPPSPPQQRPE